MKTLSLRIALRLLPTALLHVLAAQPTNSGLYDVAVLDTSTVIIVGGNGTILRTTDGGKTWTQQINSAKTFTAVHFVDKNIGWVVGEDGLIRKTTNSGSRWLRQPFITKTTKYINNFPLHSVRFLQQNNSGQYAVDVDVYASNLEHRQSSLLRSWAAVAPKHCS